MSENQTHPWSDAWPLLAIALAGEKGPAEMWQIVAAGDSINHAIFTTDEFESSLARLSAGGWVIEENGKFLASSKVGELISQKKRARLATLLDALEKLLGVSASQTESSFSNPPSKCKYPGFSSAKFEEAVLRYRAFMKSVK